jgi:hypothetical protein
MGCTCKPVASHSYALRFVFAILPSCPNRQVSSDFRSESSDRSAITQLNASHLTAIHTASLHSIRIRLRPGCIGFGSVLCDALRFRVFYPKLICFVMQSALALSHKALCFVCDAEKHWPFWASWVGLHGPGLRMGGFVNGPSCVAGLDPHVRPYAYTLTQLFELFAQS